MILKSGLRGENNMSDLIWCKGKLTKVEKIDNETLEEQCKRICEDLGYDIEDELNFYDTCEELLLEESSSKYMKYNDELYSIQSKDIDNYEEIFEAHINEDGSIGFESKYFGSEYFLEEAIMKSLDNIK